MYVYTCVRAPVFLVLCMTAGFLQTWGGEADNKQAAQDILVKLAKANSEAQLGKFSGPHPTPGGERILQALRFGGSGK